MTIGDWGGAGTTSARPQCSGLCGRLVRRAWHGSACPLWRVYEHPRVALWIGLTAVLLTVIAPSISSQQPDTVKSPQSPDSAHTPATAVIDPRAVQPERPTVATHAYTVAPGYVEIEAGVQDARPSGATQFGVPVVVKVGVLPRLQLELQGGYVRNAAPDATTAGATDLAIALKQRVLDAVPLVHDFSVQGSVKFATGARDVGTGTKDLSVLLISSRPIGAAELDLNAGYTHRSGDGVLIPTSATLLVASFGTPIRGPLGGVAELFSYPGTAGPAGTSTMVGFLFGPTLQLRPWLVLDTGAILNVRNLGANAAYAGFTYNVGRIPGFPSPRRSLDR